MVSRVAGFDRLVDPIDFTAVRRPQRHARDRTTQPRQHVRIDRTGVFGVVQVSRPGGSAPVIRAAVIVRIAGNGAVRSHGRQWGKGKKRIRKQKFYRFVGNPVDGATDAMPIDKAIVLVFSPIASRMV